MPMDDQMTAWRPSWTTLWLMGGTLDTFFGISKRHYGAKCAFSSTFGHLFSVVRGSRVVEGGKGKSLEASVGPAEGGRLRLRALQRFLSSPHYCLARPATSERGAADIYIYIIPTPN